MQDRDVWGALCKTCYVNTVFNDSVVTQSLRFVWERDVPDASVRP